MKIHVFRVVLGSFLTLSTGLADAALVSRLGGQAYYDTNLGITWIANANLADTMPFGVFGGDIDGRMSWTSANAWITAMNANGGTGYLGFNDWRLPTVNPVDGAFYDYNFAYNGTTDKGYNISAPGTPYSGSAGSELANLFYTTLGNLGARTVNGASRGCESNPNVCLDNAGPFQNLQPRIYWTATPYLPVATNTWYFDMGTGYQDATWEGTSTYYVLAVRNGDVVPIPSAIWLFSAGLIGVFGFARGGKHKRHHG